MRYVVTFDTPSGARYLASNDEERWSSRLADAVVYESEAIARRAALCVRRNLGAIVVRAPGGD